MDLTTTAARDRTTRYIYDGWRAIEERAVTGSPEAEVVRARYGFGVGLDEVLWMDRDVPRTNGNPDPVQGSVDGTIEARLWLHHDALGSVVAITDDTRNAQGRLVTVERYTYSAYGQLSAWQDNWDPATGYSASSWPTQSKVQLPYLYTGQRYDAETGYWYFKNRPYDARTGRFLRRDLIGYGDGPSLYAYTGGNPTVLVDRLGLKTDHSQIMPSARDIWEHRLELYLLEETTPQRVGEESAVSPRREDNRCGGGVGAQDRNCREKAGRLRRKAEEQGNVTWNRGDAADAAELLAETYEFQLVIWKQVTEFHHADGSISRSNERIVGVELEVSRAEEALGTTADLMSGEVGGLGDLSRDVSALLRYQPVRCGSSGPKCGGPLPKGWTAALIEQAKAQQVGNSGKSVAQHAGTSPNEVMVILAPGFPGGMSQPQVLSPDGGNWTGTADTFGVLHTHNNASAPRELSFVDVYGDPLRGAGPPTVPIGVIFPDGSVKIYVPSGNYITTFP